MGNIRLNQKYFSAGDYQKKKNKIVSCKIGTHCYIKEPQFLDLIGKKLELLIVDTKRQDYTFYEVDDTGKEKEKNIQVDFLICKFSEKGFREFWFPINQVLDITLIANKLLPMPQEDKNGCILCEFKPEQYNATIGKKIKGFFYCNESGKEKKLYACADDLQVFLKQKQAEFEKEIQSMEDIPLEIKEKI